MGTPQPLVPPEVDLRDFGFMPLDVLRLRDSDLAALSTGDEFKAAVLLWCVSWHQVPAASLPHNDKLLARYVGISADEWAAVRDGALRGFVACNDGRLYHPIIAEKALEAWSAKEAQRARTRAATEARAKKKAAEQRDDPPKPPRKPDADPSDVKRDDPRDGPRDGNRDVPRDDKRDDARDDERDDARDVHQGTGTGTGTGTGIEEKEKHAPGCPAPAHEPAGVRARTREGPEPEDLPEPTPSGSVCKAMRQAGLQQTNPSDPRLHAMLAQGATEAEFVTVAREAVDKGIASPWPWVLRVVAARREEAAAIALAPAAPQLRNGRAEPNVTTPTPPGAVYTPPPPLSAEERAAADAKRVEVMAKHRRRRVVT